MGNRAPTEPTIARGIRLPAAMWAAIARDAASLDLQTNEYLRRKLMAMLRGRDVPESHDTVHGGGS